MDSRTALKENTKLHFCNKDGGVQIYTITKELGRGGSCIVYEAYSISNTGDKKYYRIKECYPYKLKIQRLKNNELISSKADFELFTNELIKFERDFSLCNKIFYTNQMYNHMPDQLDLFCYNNTKYIVSTYSAESTLATYKPNNIKECINLMKKIAFVLANIHNQKYLFLDLKPSNILVIEDIESQIKLLDFDSLIPFDDLDKNRLNKKHNIRFSYSKGFAAAELESANIKRLGPHTDVFSVGAVLFWLLFDRTPTAIDCEADTKYQFENIYYETKNCDSKLLFCLSKFLHKTLSSYYSDRHQTMDEVVNELEKIENLADPKISRVISSTLFKPKYVYGRNKELSKINNFIKDDKTKFLYLYGMGGIGKSTLIRHYLFENQDKFDVILYINFLDNTENTICNDQNIEITTLSSDDCRDSSYRYFDIKMQKLKELLRDTNSILVIDNFAGEIDQDTLQIMHIGCKVVFVSRELPKSKNFETLKINAIDDTETLKNIFESNLERNVTNNEENLLPKLFKMVNNHSLLIELIAKQISCSHLSLSTAINIVEANGFTNIGQEKIYYEKDGLTSTDTIKNIIESLFKANDLNIDKQSILKICSLLGTSGIAIYQLKKILCLNTLDNINDLICDGWLTINNNNNITMHPIIQETIMHWKWNTSSITYAQLLFEHFSSAITFEATKNNLPRSVLNKHHELNAKDLNKPINVKKLEALLNTSEEIARNCKFENQIIELRAYTKMLYTLILFMPRIKEDFILAGAKTLIDDERLTDLTSLMKLYRKILDIGLDKKDEDLALYVLNNAKMLVKNNASDTLNAMYCNMQSEYYDACLGGAYDAETNEEKKLLVQLLNSIEHTIRYSKNYTNEDTEHLFANNLLSKATILIRSGHVNKDEIWSLIETAKEDIEKHTFLYADVRLTYYLVLAWYDSLVLEDPQLTDAAIQKALELAQTSFSSDLDFIDCAIVPCANIYLELKNFNKTLELLQNGLDICTSHKKIDVYDRKDAELHAYIEESITLRDNL